MAKTNSVCLLIIVIYFAFSKACPSSSNRLDSTTKGNNTVQFQKVKSGCQKCVHATAKREQKILKKLNNLSKLCVKPECLVFKL